MLAVIRVLGIIRDINKRGSNGLMSSRARIVELPFPNNLFAQWIEEWSVEARKNGWKSRFNYEKALKSLKKYPLPLSSGQEAKCTIQFCGDKMAKMLDRKLELYQQSSGYFQILYSYITSQVKQISVDGKIPKCVGVSNDVNAPQRRPTKRTGANVDGDDGLQAARDDPPRKKPKRAREYVPGYRSGPYAILLTLYRASQVTPTTPPKIFK
jgi:crossover junction endonuclease MUS81